MKQTFSVPFLVLGLLFCVSLIISNILEVKIISLAGITITGGLLLFPISYIINDCIAEVWGYGKARLVIWLAFALNFLVMLTIQLAIVLPPAPFWEGQEAFDAVFSATPRILAGSFVAFLVGSFLNAYVMSRMKVATRGRYFSLRAILSTLVGESADSILFFPIAFGGVVAPADLAGMMITQILLKAAYEVVILPVTIRVVSYLKRVDGSDVYDTHVSYRPF